MEKYTYITKRIAAEIIQKFLGDEWSVYSIREEEDIFVNAYKTVNTTDETPIQYYFNNDFEVFYVNQNKTFSYESEASKFMQDSLAKNFYKDTTHKEKYLKSLLAFEQAKHEENMARIMKLFQESEQ